MKIYILFALSSVAIISCGPDAAEERSRMFRTQKLKYLVEKYSKEADEYCACVLEKKPDECAETSSFSIPVNNAYKESVSHLDTTTEGFSAIRKQVSEITDRKTACANEAMK